MRRSISAPTAEAASLQSCMSVPLLMGESLVGVLSLYAPYGQRICRRLRPADSDGGAAYRRRVARGARRRRTREHRPRKPRQAALRLVSAPLARLRLRYAGATMPAIVRSAALSDLPALTAIYNHYVTHTTITFDLQPFEPEERRAWFDDHSSSGRHRLLVAADRGRQPARLRDDEPVAAEGRVRHDGRIERLLPAGCRRPRHRHASCTPRCSSRSRTKTSIASSLESASRIPRRWRCISDSASGRLACSRASAGSSGSIGTSPGSSAG